MTDWAAEAAYYSKLGWAITPLDGKKPHIPQWQTTKPGDPAAVASQWKERGYKNIGLVLGNSGIVDFELDSADPAHFFDLLGGKIPPTPAYKTGSGKYHVLFLDPGNWQTKQREGMELRGGRGQSVLPPSVHPDTGKRYEWLSGHEPERVALQPVPQRVLDFFNQSGGATEGPGWKDALGEKLGEGEGRHASLMSYLGKTVDMFDEWQHFLDAALTYAEMTQNPPYPRAIIEQQAADAWNRWRTQRERVEEPDAIVATERMKIRPLSSYTMRSIEFVWKPFLQKSAFHLLAGQKGAGKGTLLAYWAALMTTGMLDESENPRGVLWFGTEDSYEIDLKPRFVAAGGDPDLFWVANEVKLPEDMEYLGSFCESQGVGMVVFDPIVAAVGERDTNDEGSIVTAIGGLNRLADDYNLLCLGVRHLGKNLDRGALSAILGGVAWVNTPRCVLGMARDDSGAVTLEILAGNRTARNTVYEFQLESVKVEGLDEEVSKIRPVGPSSGGIEDVLKNKTNRKNYDDVKALIVEALEEQNQPLDALRIVVIGKCKSNASTFNDALEELKESGRIRFYKSPADEWMLSWVTATI